MRESEGFVEADLLAHCGPTLVGEVAATLTVTDVFWCQCEVNMFTATKKTIGWRANKHGKNR